MAYRGEPRLRDGVIYETISSLRAHGECYTMPLGVVREGRMLHAWLYPGSRVYRHAASLECIAAAVPADPLDYARVLLEGAGEHRIRACCEVYVEPYVLIEARVESVVKEDQLYHVKGRIESIRVYTPPEPFTRLSSCLVEALISYTRIRYWRDCRERLREYKSIERCLSHLERRAVGEYRRYYSLLHARLRELVEPCLERGGRG